MVLLAGCAPAHQDSPTSGPVTDTRGAATPRTPGQNPHQDRLGAVSAAALRAARESAVDLEATSSYTVPAPEASPAAGYAPSRVQRDTARVFAAGQDAGVPQGPGAATQPPTRQLLLRPVARDGRVSAGWVIQPAEAGVSARCGLPDPAVAPALPGEGWLVCASGETTDESATPAAEAYACLPDAHAESQTMLCMTDPLRGILTRLPTRALPAAQPVPTVTAAAPGGTPHGAGDSAAAPLPYLVATGSQEVFATGAQRTQVALGAPGAAHAGGRADVERVGGFLSTAGTPRLLSAAASPSAAGGETTARWFLGPATANAPGAAEPVLAVVWLGWGADAPAP
ncbi:hypothetical protein C1Y63_11725 [Corynebacterium sp. 13CS0277]|nr:hypothetical protein C1Y63_11725 [Corynebacterium sp. 13CS0277]